MPTVKPIFWRQGMFLQPQHFQLAELCQAEKLNQIREQSRPWFWGITQLSVARESLINRQVEIESGSFIFQDGAIAEIDKNALIHSRSLEGIEVDPEEPLSVYVGLRKLSQLDPNVSVIHNNTEIESIQTRFFTHAAPETAADRYVNEKPADIQTLTYKLKIVFSHELKEHSDYHLIPVTRIVLDGEKLTYDHNFIPPLINIEASDTARRLVKELKDELSGRAFQLNSMTDSASSQGFDPNMMRYRLGLQALARYVPRFTHLSEATSVSPWDVYGYMRELVGEVSIFSRGINFLGENKDGEALIPAYRHSNIWECFSAARTLITQLLNEISIGPQFLVEFTRNEQRFEVDIPPEFFEDHVDFYLILNTESPWSDHSQSFLTTAKLAEVSMVETLIERSLPGVGVLHMPGPPAGLPKKAHANYARIDIHDDKWGQVINKKSLGLQWDEAPNDLSIELVILKK